MLIALLAAILLVLVAGAAALAFVFWRVLRVYRSFQAFLVPKAEGQTSPLADMIQAASDVAARTLVMQAKSTFMGIQSGQARAAAAVQGDIAEDVLGAASPIASGLLASFPALRKTLRRNPGLVDLALPLLGKIRGGSAPAQGNGSGAAPAIQPRFKF